MSPALIVLLEVATTVVAVLACVVQVWAFAPVPEAPAASPQALSWSIAEAVR